MAIEVPQPFSFDGGFDIYIVGAQIEDELAEEVCRFVFQCLAGSA